MGARYYSPLADQARREAISETSWAGSASFRCAQLAARLKAARLGGDALEVQRLAAELRAARATANLARGEAASARRVAKALAGG
jgi:hypothetical protein